MHKITVNNEHDFNINNENHVLTANDAALQQDLQILADGRISMLLNNQSFEAELVKMDKENKTVTVSVNGRHYECRIQEPIDLVLNSLGMNNMNTRKVNDIKAPMPGLILKIMVTPGQEVKKGDPVLILEAMKMENVFKAPADAVIKEIKISERAAVEKGQVLVTLA
jgi:biotin carboxyl carrier protein